MEINIQRVKDLRDFNTHRELIFRSADRDGLQWSKKYLFDIPDEEKKYFLKYHDFYLVRNKDNPGILGSFVVFVLSTGMYWFMFLNVEESAKGKGVGRQIMNFVYEKYDKLIFYSNYNVLEFYAKTFSDFKGTDINGCNLYLATDHIPLPDIDKVVPISNRYAKDGRPGQIAVSTYFNLLQLDSEDQALIDQSVTECVELYSHLLPKMDHEK